jgi:hypothetical protein
MEMKIKSLINGQVSNVRGDIAREMVKLGVAEILPEFPKPGEAVLPPEEWAVVLIGGYKGGNKHLAVQLKMGPQVFLFWDNPRLINARREWQGGGRYINGFGRAVPAAVADEYTKRWNQNEALRGPDSIADAKRAARIRGEQNATNESERAKLLGKQRAAADAQITESDVEAELSAFNERLVTF